MIRRIDHLSIAVRDLKKAKTFFLDVLGGKELFSAPVPEQKFRWTTIELGTSCFIELIDPVGENGFVHRFLENRGEGPHHVTLQVDDLEAVHRRLEEKGISTFGYAEPFPGWKELYIHPKNAFGTLIQFAEFHPLDWINPGYIPPSYREFASPAQGEPMAEPAEVRKVKSGSGVEIEIRQGGQAVRIPEARVEELMQALSDVRDRPTQS